MDQIGFPETSINLPLYDAYFHGRAQDLGTSVWLWMTSWHAHCCNYVYRERKMGFSTCCMHNHHWTDTKLHRSTMITSKQNHWL